MRKLIIASNSSGGGGKSVRSLGFTLAEVLITLVIIGVVAAMTLPTLIQKQQKQEASARIKKFVSSFSQAILFAEAEYGPHADWHIGEYNLYQSSLDFLNTYIKEKRIMKTIILKPGLQ